MKNNYLAAMAYAVAAALFYAVNVPCSKLLLQEPLTVNYAPALVIMIAGTGLVVCDTLQGE